MFIIVVEAGFLTVVGVVVSVATLEAVLLELAMPLVLDGLRRVERVSNLVARLAAVVELARKGSLGNLRTVGVVVVLVVVVSTLRCLSVLGLLTTVGPCGEAPVWTTLVSGVVVTWRVS